MQPKFIPYQIKLKHRYLHPIRSNYFIIFHCHYSSIIFASVDWNAINYHQYTNQCRNFMLPSCSWCQYVSCAINAQTTTPKKVFQNVSQKSQLISVLLALKRKPTMARNSWRFETSIWKCSCLLILWSVATDWAYLSISLAERCYSCHWTLRSSDQIDFTKYSWLVSVTGALSPKVVKCILLTVGTVLENYLQIHVKQVKTYLAY